ncbi:SusC/RagA family TonB-linked outer membrane protein [Sphingobacterium haloxyli]|uniref:SusC/RagA family TonB-linked outer membrane protein n=1 Tax=Sphingobacterium haloxyli TaxID=2100533 RepID=A0A2S9J5L7_9SPHI|nr:SusC/RagA family TonB-linked outer membrane protein [Sphingobacterium haloxyli]PRD48072.1 SusC/RagA family TonB-linked outer membrane protein [Sphingobacterium haloxyli]
MNFTSFLRALKISAILFPCFILHVNAYVYGQTLSISKRSSSVDAIFKEIRQKAGYDFFYDANILNDIPLLNVEMQNVEVSAILEHCLKNRPFTFNIENKLITIQRTDGKTNIPLHPSHAKQVQEGRLKGTVTNQKGEALAGATVSINSIKINTLTNHNGEFSITVPVGTYEVIIGYVGHIKSVQNQITISADKTTTRNFMLTEAINAVDEVVVTALGIKREEKELGFAQQTIGAEQLATAASTNWSEGLKGKVAGLQIISGNTGPINSQSIQLRGNTSLDPAGNYALVVIDGVPMNQETTAYGNNVGAAYGTEAPVDYGNAISELRQDDIESVTVLKGPSAAALYGSRAANGALIITTKSGKKNQKLGISVNSTALFDHITNWPNYQYEYGGGSMNQLDQNGNMYYSWGNSEDGPSTNSPTAFGPKFDGQYFYQYDPVTQAQGTERTLWRPYKNNMKDFYRTGMTFENSVALQGGDSKGSMRVNLSRTDNKYITPNTGFERNSVSFNGNYEITKYIKLSSVINYNNRASENLPGFGMSNGSLNYFMMFLLPSVDIEWYKPIWSEGKENVEQLNPFSQWSSNPYYLMYVDTNPLKSNQLVGNVRADIEVSEHLNLMGRLSLNSLGQLRETHRGYTSKKHPRGYYGRQDVSSQEINADFLATYKNSFAEVFQYSIMGGGSIMDYDHRNVMSSIDALIVPGVYTLANGVNNPLVKTNDQRKRINSVYGMGSISWRDRIFLDLTARNDWSSTLPEGNNSYFYPSVSSSFILSELFQLPSTVNYLKYRASYARVGSDAHPYQTSKYYSQSSFASSAIIPGTMYNMDLKPEITSSWETGFDIRLFNDRVGLDATYYMSSTENQILSLPNDIVSGYSSRVINAGEVQNRGVELVVNGTPIKQQEFEWNIVANWALNRNKIVELNDNLERQTLANVWQGYLIGTVGGTTTDLYGTKFVRDDHGNMVFNNGVPVRTTTQEYIGNTAAKWKAGLTNNLRYKDFKLSFTVDGQWGGLIYSGTYNRSSWDGFTTNTIPGRDEGYIIGEGVVKNEDGSYSPNTVQISPQSYYGQYHQTTEPGVFKASFIKLREVSLTYTLPKKLLQNIYVNNLSLTAFGRNLFVIDNFPFWDPEGGTMNGTVFVPSLEMAPMPYTATYGGSLKFDF